MTTSTATLSTCYRTSLCLSGTGRIRGRIRRCFRVLGFGSKWQRQFRAKFRRAPLRKSLGRHLGVNFPVWGGWWNRLGSREGTPVERAADAKGRGYRA